MFLLYWWSFFSQCNCISLDLSSIPIFPRLHNVIIRKTNRKKYQMMKRRADENKTLFSGAAAQTCYLHTLEILLVFQQTAWLLFLQSTNALNIYRHKMYKKSRLSQKEQNCKCVKLCACVYMSHQLKKENIVP